MEDLGLINCIWRCSRTPPLYSKRIPISNVYISDPPTYPAKKYIPLSSHERHQYICPIFHTFEWDFCCNNILLGSRPCAARRTALCSSITVGVFQLEMFPCGLQAHILLCGSVIRLSNSLPNDQVCGGVAVNATSVPTAVMVQSYFGTSSRLRVSSQLKMVDSNSQYCGVILWRVFQSSKTAILLDILTRRMYHHSDSTLIAVDNYG